MKKILNSIKIAALILTGTFFASNMSAQSVQNMYFNIDWQLNAPLSTSFADKVSGWGVNGEAGYFLTNNVSVGAFVAYHSNNKYIDRQTLDLGDGSAITSDQQHHIFQLPFGVTGRYTLNRGTRFQPYLAAKAGAQYSEVSSQMNIFKITDDRWGFYASPEIGINTYLDPQQQVGIHLALYYSYATNKSKLLSYNVDGMNNIGLRIGIAF